jgi:hypothetical protein
LSFSVNHTLARHIKLTLLARTIDYQSAGQIRDDTLYKELVAGLQKGVFATFIMDCCHSGTVLDLPYSFVADGQQEEMEVAEDFDFGPLLSLAEQFLKGKDPMALCLDQCAIS